MQFLDTTVHVPWVIGARIESNQHADAVVFFVSGENLNVNTGGCQFPLRLSRSISEFFEGFAAQFSRESLRQASPQGFRWPQYICGPTNKRADNWPKGLNFLLTIGATGNLTFDRIHFIGRKGL